MRVQSGISQPAIRKTYFGQQSSARPALPPAMADKPIVFSTDLDSTLLRWDTTLGSFDPLAVKSNAKALRQNRPHLAVHINTGRGLTTMKQAGPVLKDVPVDLLSTGNGEDLFVNWRGERTDCWLAGLKQSDADPFWTQYIKTQTNWDAASVQRIMQTVFREDGYLPLVPNPFNEGPFQDNHALIRNLSSGERLIIQHYNDQPGFIIGLMREEASPDGTVQYRKSYPATVQAHAEQLLTRIQDGLARQGIPTETLTGRIMRRDGQYGLLSVAPPGITKATAIEGLRQFYMPRLKAAITAGDSLYNDVPMLQAQTYGQGRRQIPNYPILSGDLPGMREKLQHQANLVQMPEGRLAPAIHQQTRRILDRQA